MNLATLFLISKPTLLLLREQQSVYDKHLIRRSNIYIWNVSHTIVVPIHFTAVEPVLFKRTTETNKMLMFTCGETAEN